MSTGPRRNVELKASDPTPDRSLAACEGLAGAADHGTLWQRDTYFVVPRGRLKLREQDPGDGGPWLIQYDRPDEQTARVSRYRLIRVDDADVCRAALDAALGTRGVVEKRRRLFVWQDVRIHLDEVAELGSFLEFEAVAPPDSDLSPERRRVAELRELLAVREENLVAVGYADLLAGKQGWHDHTPGVLP